MTSTPAILITYTTLRELSAAELTLIPPEEMQRVTEIGAPRRQQEYLCGRALLRNTLERWTGEPAISHRLTTTRFFDNRCAELDYIVEEPRCVSTEYVVNNNFAFGGVNTSLVLKRWS